MRSHQINANVSVLLTAVEYDRRHDVVLRDQAVKNTLTPAQAREFWRRVERGESGEAAAWGALGSRPY